MDSCILKNGSIVLSDSQIDNAVLIAQEGIISYAGPGPMEAVLRHFPEAASLPVEDCRDGYILPPLLELHIHGAFSVGFEQGPSAEDLRRLAAHLATQGIGAFVPTILWEEQIVVELVRAIKVSGLFPSKIPGIYLEGPFVNPEKRGGIPLQNIARPSKSLLKKILHVCDGLLVIMTLAPELEGIDELYPLLEGAGVVIALGHSNTSGIDMKLPTSRFSVTHLFNAMSSLDHRSGPGLVGYVLGGGNQQWVELNADGIHVNTYAMHVASRCLEPSQLILTSDAIAAAGMPEGMFSYFGQDALSDKTGVRYKETGTLIGSNRLGMELIKSFMAVSGWPLYACIRAMSANPWNLLNQMRPGLVAGAPAELFIWDRNLNHCWRSIT